MPLILMCGPPCSGKSELAKRISKEIQEEIPELEIHIINEESLNVNKHETYSDMIKEKDLWGLLWSEVDRLLTKDNLVILDSMNYIKGFWYELHTYAWKNQTRFCVVFVNESLQYIKTLNKKENQYTEELLGDLFNRLEVPKSTYKWDSPLFE